MVFEPGLRTPRMVMQRCSHSITTITPRGSRMLIDGIGDLGGQPLLHLGSLGVEIDEAGQLAEPGDLAVSARDVADVGNPGERHEMVLAAAPHLDVLDQHQLVVAEVEDGGQHRLRILAKPAEHLRVRPRNALRGIAQSVPIGIFTDPDQDLPYRGDDPGMIKLSYRGGEMNRVDADNPAVAAVVPARCRPRCGYQRPRRALSPKVRASMRLWLGLTSGR